MERVLSSLELKIRDLEIDWKSKINKEEADIEFEGYLKSNSNNNHIKVKVKAKHILTECPICGVQISIADECIYCGSLVFEE